MEPPFTTEQFFAVFEQFNRVLFPVQMVLFLLGIAVLTMVRRGKPGVERYIGGFLGILWLWTGIAYHLSFFTGINRAAWGFGAIFILQGLFFLYETLYRKRLAFRLTRDWRGMLGYFFAIFGLILYPLISFLVEGTLERTISLGLPCPTTIFTFGFLMLAMGRMPRYLLIIPSIWALIGTSAAVNFGVYQDYMMILAAIVANAFILSGSRREGE